MAACDLNEDRMGEQNDLLKLQSKNNPVEETFYVTILNGISILRRIEREF